MNGQKRNRTNTKRVCALLLLSLLALSALASCGERRIRFRDGWYVDSEAGIRYQVASVSYEPMAAGEEYAACEDYMLYTVGEADPSQWLAEWFDGIGALYYAEGVHLPTLEEFKADCLYLGNAGDRFTAIAHTNHGGLIKAVVAAFSDCEKTILPPEYEAAYQLKFTSASYDWFCYSVMYIVADGRNILYDRGTGVTVDCGDLLKDLIDPELTVETTSPASETASPTAESEPSPEQTAEGAKEPTGVIA